METTEEKTLPQGITQKMIADAITKFGESNVKYAELPLDDNRDDFVTVLVRKPSRQVINEYAKWSTANPGKADEILVNSCLLSHKDQVKADDGLFMGAVDAIAQLISIRKATIKNI